jgi:tetratricopeptide (TPR) repeat protein
MKLKTAHIEKILFLCLIVIGIGVYSNNFEHPFHLDSGHSIKENKMVTSLRYIPKYFADPTTFTSYLPNSNYRPILQATYALNYQISGYNTWSWHLGQILLHLVCVIALYFFVRHLLVYHILKDSKSQSKLILPFVIALIFTVHTVNAGVINYLSARSSLLVAAFLLPSFVLYMKSRTGDLLSGYRFVALLLFVLALFTKVEAVAGIAVYFLYEVLLYARDNSLGNFFRDIRSVLDRQLLLRLAPFMAAIAINLLIRQVVIKDYMVQARSSADISSVHYFLTQLTALWIYVKNWFAPVWLIADNDSYSVISSIWHPHVMLALAGWGIVAILLFKNYRKYPYLMFIAVSGLALISPTSSFLPLAEMVNEHRPYLPMAIFSLLWLIPLLLWIFNQQKSVQRNAIAVLLLFIGSLVQLTWERNKVFHTSEAYYRDILDKQPSCRAFVNYGLIFMKKGDVDQALHFYLKSLELCPHYFITHINLALAFQKLDDEQRALYHYQQAIENEPYSALALSYRGHYYLLQGKYQRAITDLEHALPKTRDVYSLYKSLAKAYAGLGDWEKSVIYSQNCMAQDIGRFEKDIVDISAPFWTKQEFYKSGIEYYIALSRLLPDRWYLYYNMGSLANKLKDKKTIQFALKQMQTLRPDIDVSSLKIDG